MNPYEEPNSVQEDPSEYRRSICWLAIAQAGAIYFLISTTLNLLPYTAYMYRLTSWNTFMLIALTTGPWAFGAAYLTFRLKDRWIQHGIIYSALSAVLSYIIEGVIGMYSDDLRVDVLLIRVSIDFAVASVTTMIAIAVTRAVLKGFRYA